MKQKHLTCYKNNQVTWSFPRQLDNTFYIKTYSLLQHFCYCQFQTQKPCYRVLSIARSKNLVLQIRTFNAVIPVTINKSNNGIIITHYTPTSLHTASINSKLELQNGILTLTFTT